MNLEDLTVALADLSDEDLLIVLKAALNRDRPYVGRAGIDAWDLEPRPGEHVELGLFDVED